MIQNYQRHLPEKLRQELDADPNLALAAFEHINKMKLLRPWTPGIVGIHDPNRLERRILEFPLTAAQAWTTKGVSFGWICLPVGITDKDYTEYATLREAMDDIDRRLREMGYALAEE